LQPVVALVDLTLSFGTGRAVSVKWSTRDETATAPEDYAHATGDIRVPPHDTVASIPVLVAPDFRAEPPETIGVDISEPQHASIVDGTGVVTVLDDDPMCPHGTPTLIGTDGDDVQWRRRHLRRRCRTPAMARSSSATSNH
jgi:hypothetical protein